jgi:transposase
MNTENISNKSSAFFSPQEPEPVACIGLDWGDQKHAFVLADSEGRRERGTIDHSAENLHQWFQGLAQRYGGRPVALAIEASRGAVIHALLAYQSWLSIYPINPMTSARYRTAFTPSGAKDDLPDAQVLLELVQCHRAKLRRLEPQDATTVKLRGLVETRRDLVDRRTALLNQLTSLLKSYYPQALELVGNLDTELAMRFLERWPDLISLKAARPGALRRFYYQHQVRSRQLVEKRLAQVNQTLALTTDDAIVSVAVLQLRQLLDELKVFRKHIPLLNDQIKTVFASHPNAHLFRELPGAGPQLAPRLCVAFGTDLQLYTDPSQLQKYAGVAPVREKSGNQLWTHWRWRAPRFLRQTFVEWAGQTVRYSEWARLYYQRMIQKGKTHAVTLRALAFKWIRILWKCWQTGTPYNEQTYLRQLRHRKSPNAVPVT